MKSSMLTLILLIASVLSLNANYLTITENSDSCLKLHFSYRNIGSGYREAASYENQYENNYNLPVISTIIQVPSHTRPEVFITNTKTDTKHDVRLTKTDADVFVDDNMVMVSEPFVMRNNLLATLTVQPQVYNAKQSTLLSLNECDIEIRFISDNSYYISRNIRQTGEFKSWLSGATINYHDISRSGDASGSLLIIYNQNAVSLSNIQPLIDWKHQKGWEVHAVSTSVAGSSNTAIKNYIQNAYNTWENPPEYILMLGRVTSSNTVPTYSTNYNHQTVGDYQYTLLDGSDIIPDAYIGRLTFSSVDQVTAMINKIIAYEKYQGISATNWFEKNLLISDETDSGPSCTTNIDYVRDLMLTYNPSAINTYVNAEPFVSQMTSAINTGVGNVYYRGHNGYSGLSNTDISNLVNTGKFPFLSFITCFSGNFGQQSQLSIGEQFLRVGTASLPKGGIGFIGASCETHTCLNNIMTGAIAYGFYREGLTNQGQALLRAKLGLLACYPQYPDIYIPQNFLSINLLGDPTVDIWLKQPAAITVTHAQTVSLNNGSLQVSITDATGNAVENAKVCILKGNDEVFEVGFTDSMGICNLQWGNATSGTAILTVTKPNCITYQGIVTFSGDTSSFNLVNPQSFSQLCTGTTYAFPISIQNNQYTSLTNVYAKLRTSSQYVNIASDSIFFGNMTLNQAAQSIQNVAFSVSQDCPKGTELNFSLQIFAMNGQEQIQFIISFNTNENGPNLTIQSTQTGSDNVLTPGETSTFILTLKNIGSIGATGINAHLQCTDPNLIISQPVQSYPDIAPNQTGSNLTAFSLTAGSAIYNGTPVMISIELDYNTGSSQILYHKLTIGNINSTTMTGPDQYGYICVANSDNHPLAKPYSWVELNPSLGGSGTAINLIDNTTEGSGTYQTINVPFNFKYYGRNYNQITVCSNGFLMPGSQGSQEWMNWLIPGPMVPRPIIAPFWDDLIIQSDSKIYYKYNSANSTFTIEWYKLKNKYNVSMQETFEVIIYNSTEYATQTGDNAFLFQYQTFNNVDAGNYGVSYVDHGQYASVGIADHTGLTGIGYTYQNIYPATASTIYNNSTLFFTTMQTQGLTPAPQVQSYTFTELAAQYPNNQIDSGETISIIPFIHNSGTGALIAPTLTLTVTDNNVTIISNTSSVANLEQGQNAPVDSPFIFQINHSCPNLSNISFDLQISSLGHTYHCPFNIVVNAPQIDFTSFLSNGNEIQYLDPQSTIPVSLLLTNLSNLPLYNASFTLQNNTAWSATPNQFVFDITPNGQAMVNFDLTLSDITPLGTNLTITGIFSIPDSYSRSFNKQLMVGQMNSIFSESFDISTSLQNWSLSANVALAPATVINQTGFEVLSTPVPTASNYIIITPPVTAYDSQIIKVSFKYYNANPNSVSNLSVSYNGSSTWQNVYNFSTIKDSLVTANLYLTNLSGALQTLRLRWQSVIQPYCLGNITLDDIKIEAVHHAEGYACGTVYLDNYIQNVTQVKVYSAAYPDNFVHPDQTGYFALPLYQGTYPIVKAELDYYIPQTLNNVTVVSGLNSNGNNFNLAYCRKPVNLTYNINQNILALSWQLDDYSDQAFCRIEPSYYKLSYTHNNQTEDDTTSQQSYQLEIQPGEYRLFIKAVYLTNNNLIVQSDSSNVIDINYTPIPGENPIPYTFGLHQNYPNPFNPKTKISFSLNQKGNASLVIYNLKGEAIRTLLNESKSAGEYCLLFDGLDANARPLASGVYFYKLTSGNKSILNKMILLK